MEISDDLKLLDEIFEIVHMIEIERGRNIVKQTPKSHPDITKPIWCKNISALQKRQVEKFYKNRIEALDNLMTLSKLTSGKYKVNLDFINYYADYFYIDNDCLCNKLPTKRLGGGKTGTVYTILNSEDPKEQIFILKQIKNVSLNLYLSLRINPLDASLSQRNEAFYINSLIMKKKAYDSYFTTQKKFREERYCLQVPSDNFTNQTLLHMILNKLLGDHPNYLYQFDSFYCSKGKTIDGYNITEKSNSGDLSEYIRRLTTINQDILLDMIQQIMTPLFILKHPIIGFLHSDLKPKNIFVNTINEKPQFKIADFDKSSIFYRNIRFYNNSFNYTLGGINPNVTPFPLHKSSIGNYIYYNMSDINYYGKLIGFHEYIMSNPEGFYSSFDIYTFFYSLILEPRIFEWMILNQNSNIWDIYDYIFHRSEISEWEKFMGNITNINLGKIKGDITSIKFYWEQFKLNEFKLRYDINKIYEILGINIKSSAKEFPKETIELIQKDKPKSDIFYISYDNHLCKIEPNDNDTECKTNIYSKISKDIRDFGYSYLYNYDSL